MSAAACGDLQCTCLAFYCRNIENLLKFFSDRESVEYKKCEKQIKAYLQLTLTQVKTPMPPASTGPTYRSVAKLKPEHMPKHMSNCMPNSMSHHMSKHISDQMSNHISHVEPTCYSQDCLGDPWLHGHRHRHDDVAWVMMLWFGSFH